MGRGSGGRGVRECSAAMQAHTARRRPWRSQQRQSAQRRARRGAAAAGCLHAHHVGGPWPSCLRAQLGCRPCGADGNASGAGASRTRTRTPTRTDQPAGSWRPPPLCRPARRHDTAAWVRHTHRPRRGVRSGTPAGWGGSAPAVCVCTTVTVCVLCVHVLHCSCAATPAQPEIMPLLAPPLSHRPSPWGCLPGLLPSPTSLPPQRPHHDRPRTALPRFSAQPREVADLAGTNW